MRPSRDGHRSRFTQENLFSDEAHFWLNAVKVLKKLLFVVFYGQRSLMVHNREHFRDIIFYDFRRGITQQQYSNQLNSIFGNEAKVTQIRIS